jgi:hypothetical protein
VPEDDGFEAVKSLLDVAQRLVCDLQNDPSLARLLTVFGRMPEEDREIIIGAMEREVQTRLLSREVADSLTKIALRPNPNARLYLRVVEPEDRSNEVEMMAFFRASYSLLRGIDSLDPQWRTMVVLASPRQASPRPSRPTSTPMTRFPCRARCLSAVASRAREGCRLLAPAPFSHGRNASPSDDARALRHFTRGRHTRLT